MTILQQRFIFIHFNQDVSSLSSCTNRNTLKQCHQFSLIFDVMGCLVSKNNKTQGSKGEDWSGITSETWTTGSPKSVIQKKAPDFSEIASTSTETSDYVDLFDRIRESLISVQDFIKKNTTETTAKAEAKRCLGWSICSLDVVISSRTIKQLVIEKEDRELCTMLTILKEKGGSSSMIAEYLTETYRSKDTGRNIKTRESTRKLTIYKKIEMKQCLEIDESKDCDYIEHFKSTINEFGFDIFKAEQKLSQPLSYVVYYIMLEWNLFQNLNISPPLFMKAMVNIEKAYRSDISYHNAVHAADVVQTINSLLAANSDFASFTDLEMFALILGGAIHDVDHPGVNNQYHVKTKSELAILYNDQSVLEHHHLATAFKIFYKDKDNFLSCLDKEEEKVVRDIIINLVMSTDMHQHVKVTSAFQLFIDRSYSKEVTTHSLDNLDAMCGVLHFADISNPTKPLEIYNEWVNRITEEFFMQGDLERKAGVQVSPLCDNKTTDISEMQLGFIDYIVKPICDVVTKFLKMGDDESKQTAKKIEKNIIRNRQFYNKKQKYVIKGEEQNMVNFSKNANSLESNLIHIQSDIKFETPYFFSFTRKDDYTESGETIAQE